MSASAVARAQALLAVRRGAEAIPLLVAELARSPDSYSILCLLSTAYTQAGAHEHALSAAGRAIAAKPDGSEAFVLASFAAGSLGGHDKAVETAEEAVRLAPENSRAHVCLAMARANLSPPSASALESAQQAVRLAPESPNAHFAVGYCAQKLGRRAEAVAAYRSVLALRPDHAEALNNLGGLQAKRGRLAKAAADLRASIVADPRSDTARRNIDVVARNFLVYLQRVVLVCYLATMALRLLADQDGTSVARTTYLVIGGGGLVALAGAAIFMDLRLPRALRSYYHRLFARDKLLAARAALLVLALGLILSMAFVSGSKATGMMVGSSWLCLIASSVIAWSYHSRAHLPASKAEAVTVGLSDAEPRAETVRPGPATARVLEHARRLHRRAMALYVACLCVLVATPCVALLTGHSLRSAALAAAAAVTPLLVPGLIGLLLHLRSRRVGNEARASASRSATVARILNRTA